MRVMSAVAWHHPDVRPKVHKKNDDGLAAHQIILRCVGRRRGPRRKNGFVAIGRNRMIPDVQVARRIVGENRINLAEARACLR